MTYPELEAFRQRIPVPKGMTAAQWEVVKADIRERSFFMAGISNAEILDLFKREQERLIGNKISPQEYRRALREGLDKLGYRAPMGKDGTIKDLASFQRQNLVMETNRRLAAGYANYQTQLEQRDLYPAKQMVRLTLRREPRDWNARWKEAAKQLPQDGTYNVSKKAALVDSPIWSAISRFGVPYPIYDYNSGMGDKMLSREEAAAIGIQAPAVPPLVTPDSFNANLQAVPRVKDEVVMRALERELEGLARRENDTFVFTDPNGTRPTTAASLAATIGQENRYGLPLYQKEALLSYMDGKMYSRDYFSRLVKRVQGEPKAAAADPLGMGLRFGSQNQRTEFLTRLQTRERGGWDGGDSYPSARRDVSKAISESNRNGVVLVVRNWQTAKDLGPATRALTGNLVQGKPEVFWDPMTLFVVNNILERSEGPTIVTVEEKADD